MPRKPKTNSNETQMPGCLATPPELSTMARRLAEALRKSGGLLPALEEIAAGFSNPLAAAAVMTVRSDVRAGLSLSAAMRRHPPLFDHHWVGLITAGEVNGDLPTRLEALAEAILGPGDASAGTQIKGFEDNLLERMGAGISMVAALEQLTEKQADPRVVAALRAMVGEMRRGTLLSEALTHHPAVFSASAVGWATSEEQRDVRFTLHRWRLGVGAEGEPKSVAPEDVAEFKRRFSGMLAEGETIVGALVTLARYQENVTFKRTLHHVQQEITSGKTLTEAFGEFPDVFGHDYIEVLRELESGNEALQKDMLNVLKEDLLTLNQAVEFLGTSKPTLHRLLKQGNLQGLKVGRQWRFRKADLVAYMERRPPTVAVAAADDLDTELEFFSAELGQAETEFGEEDTDADPSGAKTIRLVNSILMLAIKTSASDIHLDPMRGHLVLRLRHDGVLQEIRRIPFRLTRPLIDRLKVMADMNIAERTIPQDGRIHIRVAATERNYDLRVSSCPTCFGESLVIRILIDQAYLPGLDKIQLTAEQEATLRSWMHWPNGLFIISGPMGSGKTTVLYSLLGTRLSPEVKTITIEDPVEVMLDYATQVHVNRKSGLTVENALRAFLRQDPDVIMIGELLDREPATLALHAALTGHLVCTGMHANDTAGVVRRLLDWGVEPFIVSSALIGVTSQRLARRICEECKAPVEVPPELLKRVRSLAAAGGYTPPASATFHKGLGCDRCRRTGYKGRIPIYEIMTIDATLADAILRTAPGTELTSIAVANGMRTLMAEGLRLAVEGQTTVEEVMRVMFM